MNLIFIRHGDPDYSIDSLTEKGWREAKLLAERTAKWDVKEFYCSPLGRAKDTASLTLKKFGKEAIIYDWLQEFYYPVIDPVTKEKRIEWDFMPDYWTTQPLFYDKNEWMHTPIMQSGNIAEEFEKVKNGIDMVLKEHGYERYNNYYKVLHGNDDTFVFFCHFGVQFAILSHLLGIAAPVLWQGCFTAPTSVTVLSSEERVEGNAYFRLRTMGDTSHLYEKEPISRAGMFRERFCEEDDREVSPILKTF